MEATEMTTVRVDVPNEELTLAMQESEAMLADPAAKKRADFSFVNNIFGTLSESEADARQLRCTCGVQQCVCF